MINTKGKAPERIVSFTESEAVAIIDEIKEALSDCSSDGSLAFSTLRKIAGDFEDGLEAVSRDPAQSVCLDGIRLWKVTQERYVNRSAIFAAETEEQAIDFYKRSWGGSVYALEVGDKTTDEILCDPFDPSDEAIALYKDMDPLPAGVGMAIAATPINTEEDVDPDYDEDHD